MFNVESNITQVMAGLSAKLHDLQHPDKILREVSATMLAVVKDRIHVEGKAADGQLISDKGYSKEYMKTRTGVFSTNETVSKGKNKGQTKKTGVFTRGEKKGQQRPNYNRTSDTKVIISLTRQTESDFSIIAVPDGYGLGYKNPDNAKKAEYVENTYKKKIFALTEAEREQAFKIAVEATNAHLK